MYHFCVFSTWCTIDKRLDRSGKHKAKRSYNISREIFIQFCQQNKISELKYIRGITIAMFYIISNIINKNMNHDADVLKTNINFNFRAMMC